MSDMFGRARFVAPLVALLVAAGCGGGGDSGGGSNAGGGEQAATPMQNPADPATAGSVAGMATFTGMPATGEAIDMREEPVCAEKHNSPPMTTPAVVGEAGGLANAFVYVKSGPATSLEFPTPTESVVLDQNGCVYAPHVLALQSGQSLVVRNSDAVLHNVNATPSENRPFNRSQPQAGMEFTTEFSTAEVMIPVRCDVHGWMDAYIGVTDHPYHAVTAADGSFSLPNLPPGDYEIEAWHEQYGTLTQMVTVPASGEVEASFEFSDAMADRFVPMGEPLYVDHASGTLAPRSIEASSDGM